MAKEIRPARLSRPAEFGAMLCFRRALAQGQTWTVRKRYPTPSTQTRCRAQWQPGATAA
jgi:hypothetical protein